MSYERRKHNRRQIVVMNYSGPERRRPLCNACAGRGYRVLTIKHSDGRVSPDPTSCETCLGTGYQS